MLWYIDIAMVTAVENASAVVLWFWAVTVAAVEAAPGNMGLTAVPLLTNVRAVNRCAQITESFPQTQENALCHFPQHPDTRRRHLFLLSAGRK
jgi:hypothetical protein